MSSDSDTRKLKRFLKDSMLATDDLLRMLDERFVSADQRERNLIDIWKAEIEGQYVFLDGKYEAIRRGRTGLKPPGDDVIKRLEKLVDEVDDLIRKDKNVDTIVAVATNLIKVVNDANLA